MKLSSAGNILQGPVCHPCSMLTNAWLEMDKSLTTQIVKMQLSCDIQVSWRVSSMENFQRATGVQKQPEGSSHTPWSWICPAPGTAEGGTQGSLAGQQGMLNCPHVHCRVESSPGTRIWPRQDKLYPLNLTSSECCWCCLKSQAWAAPGDISDGFVPHAVSTRSPFRFHSTCPRGEHLRLPLAPTAALGVAALYSDLPQHFYSSCKTPWALQQLLLMALTDPQRLRCPGQQHCSHDRKSSWFLT